MTDITNHYPPLRHVLTGMGWDERTPELGFLFSPPPHLEDIPENYNPEPMPIPEDLWLSAVDRGDPFLIVEKLAKVFALKGPPAVPGHDLDLIRAVYFASFAIVHFDKDVAEERAARRDAGGSLPHASTIDGAIRIRCAHVATVGPEPELGFVIQWPNDQQPEMTYTPGQPDKPEGRITNCLTVLASVLHAGQTT